MPKGNSAASAKAATRNTFSGTEMYGGTPDQNASST
jgi:hypothetical protein